MRRQSNAASVHPLDDDYIETYTGKKFFLSRPEFDIVDIAHSLSMQCRFTGHCLRRYSTAEHSVLVSLIMEDAHLGDPFEGLMHDAHEAYICDLAKPWKPQMPDYVRLEKQLEAKCRQHFAIPGGSTSPGAKVADSVALILEARVLIRGGAADWDLGWMDTKMHELIETMKDDYHIMCWDVESAKREFMGRYNKLRKLSNETVQS